MAGTPSRAGRHPKQASRFVSDVLAENVRVLRAIRGLTQEVLADRMSFLGHGWKRQTVGQIARHDRSTSVDELLGLAIALDTSVPRLIDPRGFDKKHPFYLDVGSAEPLDLGMALDLVTGGGAVAIEWDQNPMRVTWGRIKTNPSFIGLLDDIYHDQGGLKYDDSEVLKQDEADAGARPDDSPPEGE